MIDSHCHLDAAPLFEDLDNVLSRAKKVGIEKLLTICTNFESFKKIKKITQHDGMIYGTYGIHPHEVESNNVTVQTIVDNVKNTDKIIGIGETGLDFYYNHSDKNVQIRSFEEHIKASIELNLPLIVHSRNADFETFNLLNKYANSNIKILMHCFTGSNSFAQKLLLLNSFFSASGIITFNNSIELQNTFKEIPLKNLLIETDSPYLAPVPKRGKNNEPSYVKFTADKLAEIKGISSSDLIRSTTKNFNDLFLFN
jgi:TatD DNase family protein